MLPKIARTNQKTLMVWRDLVSLTSGRLFGGGLLCLFVVLFAYLATILVKRFIFFLHS